jgi:hypothetical protein
MFHLELRHFPHSVCRFNLSEEELRPIVSAWARGQILELGERRWSPHEARLTVIEGPRLEAGELSMGRGWRAAQRRGADVTERMLRSVAVSVEAASASDETLRALLGADAGRLLGAWRETSARFPEMLPSERLARAERALADGRRPGGGGG